MRFRELCSNLPVEVIQGSIDCNVTNLSYDSRKVKVGSAFFVLRGSRTQGAYYVEQAIRHGAVVLVVEDDYHTSIPITIIRTADARRLLSRASAIFYGNPSKRMNLIGITGTKGKTTVACLIKKILETAHRQVGLIGTMGIYYGDNLIPPCNTTPESLDLHRYLHDMEQLSIYTVVIEVSSQALKQYRVEDLHFRYAIFTNFSKDHIGKNEHPNLADYFYSKKKLFFQSDLAILNRDDAVYIPLIKELPCRIITYGIQKNCDYKATNLRYVEINHIFSTSFTVKGKRYEIPLPGIYSVYNALSAILVAQMEQVPEMLIKKALSTFRVRGRMELISLPLSGYHVYIDYAHNPLSMKQILTTIGYYKNKNQIIVLFGCGGNRSPERRTEMGRISGIYAGFSVLTEDNSRYEPLRQIIAEIESGISKVTRNYKVIYNRRDAIAYCLKRANPGDVVLLLGKGHETYQEVKGVRYPFDERKIVQSLYREMEDTVAETMRIDGKKIAAEIKAECRKEVEEKGIKACLAVILVGNDPASSVYVNNKKKACEQTAIKSLSYELPDTTTEEELLTLIDLLNKREDVNGILVQLPLPKGMNEEKILMAIDPKKDVDGFHPMNVGALSIGKKGFVSCTPAGVIQLLKRSGIEIEGKNCVVVGRSNIVGKPMALLLLRENGTVTITHSRTANLKEVTKQADILVVAIGKPKFITAEYVKEGAAVIDVGIHRMENGKLCGDVDFDSVDGIAGAMTPVPGGVGPMTIAMLMANCLASAKGEV